MFSLTSDERKALLLVLFLLILGLGLNYFHKTHLASSQNYQDNFTDLSQNSSPINLNSASFEQLLSVPGIGPSTASKIIDKRNESEFESLEQLKEIPGIKDKRLEALKPYLSLE